MSGDISLRMRERIVTLVESGQSYRQIASTLGIGVTTVSRWITRHNEGEPLLGKRSSCGRKGKLSPEDKEGLITTSEEHPFKTATDLRRELELDVSVRSVRRILSKEGLNGRLAAKKEMLTDDHRQRRLEFATEHQHTDWAGVAFSDEKSFCRGACGQVWVRRPAKERYNPKYLKSVRKSGRFSVNVWAYVTSAGPGEICRIRGYLNSVEYIRILETVLLPTLHEDQPLLFVQDRCSVHQSHVVQEWFRDHQQIRVLENWPSKGADFNVIENVWAEMVRVVDGARCRNADELWEQIMVAWNGLKEKPQYFLNLTESMPTRFATAIQNEGSWTGY